ncbi:carbohydrate-binding domain-containing protein [Butyrivibrio sp. AE3009]|uniref:carbohydrate-binding domain-containing protein n=1 Tax=Butyrivibrio sp. AE3009 TaxID=1280666 RepID=UPI0003B44267|nr:carbohydrate-binding domain-containing protein [Butyrivibrio sp. AE3009]
MKRKNRFLAILFLSTALVVGGCGASTSGSTDSVTVSTDTKESQDNAGSGDQASPEERTQGENRSTEYLSSGDAVTATSGLLNSEEMFSDRDLEQEADLTDATYITLESGKDVAIDSEGVYVIRGTATDSSIIVDADSAKVQLVLDGVSITNADSPAIYVKAADKVFITTTDSENTLTVTGAFTADGDNNTDAVIYSKDDVVFNGTGTLTITSTANGISGKDDVKFTGGTYYITSEEDAIEAKDSIRISDGSFTINAKKDALHSENSDDDSLGYIYISGGTFDITASDDGIQATTVLMMDGGTFEISASEGLEATFVQINDGKISIEASDDGINASNKSSQYNVVIEINGGELTVNMGSGDTDALDANGNLYINGGTVDITAQFAFDFDGEAQINGGTVTVNGEEVTEITNSMTFGGPGGGPGGQGGFGGRGGQGGPNGDQSGNDDSSQRPENFDPSNMPEGFEKGNMPENFDPSNMPERSNDSENQQNNTDNKGNRGTKGNKGN